MVPARYRVVERVQELADTATLVLEPVDCSLPPMRPGQFLMLWAFGVGEVPISLAGLPDGDGRVRHTIRAVGAVTRALVAAEPGEVLGARGPFGTPWDLTAARGRDVLVVAGGIGLAPLRPVVTEVLAERDRYGHVSLLVGTRTPDLLLYADELHEWRARFDLDVLVTVDAAPPTWQGEVGVVTGLLPRAGVDPARTTAFLCGPEIMMRLTARALLASGVTPDAVQVSLERNMACAIAQCGHCQIGPVFVCREGPVFTWDRAAPLLEVRDR
jgi:NAD(P)H-flavin reductase